MATVANDIDAIRREMAKIRRELHEDVQEVVASAEAATDWRRYLRMYPWAALGAAFAVGYLVVPKRRRSIPRDLATQADVAKVREVVEEARETGREKKKGVIGMLVGAVAPMALRAAQGYAMQYLEGWMTQELQRQQMMAGGPPPAAAPPRPPGGPGRPGSPGGPGRPS